MTNKTVYAYTPPGSDFPPFVNLSRQEGGPYTLTVRSQGNAGRDIGSIALYPEAVEALATEALADLYREPAAPAVTDEMVGRFLGWKLPQDFSPDCYVRFDRDAAGAGSWPVGTNLLTAVQARAMLEHVLGVTPSAVVHPPTAAMQPLDHDGKGAAGVVAALCEAAGVDISGLDLASDTPLAPACDLSGDGACEACQ